jgi:hypothetical protein
MSSTNNNSFSELFSSLSNGIKVIIFGLILAIGISYAFAWTEPTVAPPNGNVEAPINIGSSSQYKDGALGVGGVFHGYSDAIFDGSILLDITNQIQFSDSNWAIKHNNSCSIQGLTNCLEFNAGVNNGVFVFKDGSITSMVINADTGNVGIGTTNPQAKLHVAGDIRFDASVVDSISGSSRYLKINRQGRDYYIRLYNPSVTPGSCTINPYGCPDTCTPVLTSSTPDTATFTCGGTHSGCCGSYWAGWDYTATSIYDFSTGQWTTYCSPSVSGGYRC